MTAPGSTFGSRLKERRTAQRFSQLELAARAEVSQRHLSFLETGRSKPSREMVIHLATTLDLPLRAQNELLLAAGFAPLYPETGLDEPAMEQVRHVLEFLLSAHEPYPAMMLDRRWDLVAANQAATRLTGFLLGHDQRGVFGKGSLNLARLAFHPRGLRTVTVDWERTAGHLLARLEREVEARAGDHALVELLDEVLSYADVSELRRMPRTPAGTDLLLPIHYRTEDLELQLFSTFSTIGAAYDVTLEEIRLETFFPANVETEATLRRLAEAQPSDAPGGRSERLHR